MTALAVALRGRRAKVTARRSMTARAVPPRTSRANVAQCAMTARAVAPRARRANAATRCALALACFTCALALALACPAHADEPDDAPREPPPEAAPGDWSAEHADTLAPGWVATTFAAAGAAGTRPTTAEHVRFRAAGSDGTLRTGEDPLAGGRLASPAGGGVLHLGALAPRWGCGLLLGAAAQPWSLAATDRGENAAWRGRAGEGAAWTVGDATAAPTVAARGRAHGGANTHASAELLAGRFAKQLLAAARVRWRCAALGAVVGANSAQASAAWERATGASELALDSHARWRAEFSLRRTGRAGTLTLRARGGLAGYRSLAEPARTGPAQVLALGARRVTRAYDARASAALWRFAPGAAGAAATLEVHRSLGHHAAVDLGFEEQHGTRRDPALASVPAAGGSLRQSVWSSWRGRIAGRALELRHELVGGRAFARQAVRRVVAVRAESALPRGAVLAVTHDVWSSGRGEQLWVPETDSDRLTLRAASGSGERTRVELAVPLLAGRARAGTEWSTARARRTAPRWTLEWTRRTRQ